MLKRISTFAVTIIMILCFTACGNSEFEEKGDYLTGNKWEASNGNLIELNTDGTYKFYRSSADKTNNYSAGGFEVFNGQDAINYLFNEYGFSEDSQRSTMAAYNVEEQYYYVLVLNAKECIIDGQNTLEEETKTEYFGYYTPKNMYLDFTNLNTMEQINFYKK